MTADLADSPATTEPAPAELTENRPGPTPKLYDDDLVLDDRLRELAVRYRPLAVALVRKYIRKFPVNVGYEEWQALGELAMIKALTRYESYCAARGFEPFTPDGEPSPFLVGYIAKVVTGHLYDTSRAADHVSRSQRRKLKEIAAAEDAGIHGEAALSAATGLSPAKIRQAQEADHRRAVSLDAGLQLDNGGEVAASIVDDSASVDSQATVSYALRAFLACFNAQPAEVQVILSLRYFYGRDFSAIAAAMFTTEERVTELHDAAVQILHAALVKAVSD